MNRLNIINNHLFTNKKSINIFNIHNSFGQPINGCDLGSILLKERGLISNLINKNHIINEYYLNNNNYNITPVIYNTKGKIINNCYNVGMHCYDIYNIILNNTLQNNLSLVIGGDHSIACGSIGASLTIDENIGVIWIDAHADINTPDTSNSMNIHGMPLSFILGLSNNITGFEWMNIIPKLKPENLVYIGLRDIEDSELEYIKLLNIKTYTINDIKNKGIIKIMDDTLQYLHKCNNIHVSWDIDSIDPLYAPSTGTKVSNGLLINEAIYIANILSKSNKLMIVDMVELNPLIGNIEESNKTADIANKLILSLFNNID